MTSELNDAELVDHRTRVGQEKRQKMRARLIESALVVFAEKGIDATAIDDVIVQAGVSRGTFYNYFRTNPELVAAVGETLSNEIVSLIEAHVGELENPVEILATGLRLFLRTARAYPKYANFLWRAGFNADAAGHLIYAYLPGHIQRAIERGAFQVRDVTSGLGVIVGLMLAGVYGMAARGYVDEKFTDEMVHHTLLALGVSVAESAELTRLPLPEISLPEDSLLVRSNQ